MVTHPGHVPPLAAVDLAMLLHLSAGPPTIGRARPIARVRQVAHARRVELPVVVIAICQHQPQVYRHRCSSSSQFGADGEKACRRADAHQLLHSMLHSMLHSGCEGSTDRGHWYGRQVHRLHATHIWSTKAGPGASMHVCTCLRCACDLHMPYQGRPGGSRL